MYGRYFAAAGGYGSCGLFPGLFTGNKRTPSHPAQPAGLAQPSKSPRLPHYIPEWRPNEFLRLRSARWFGAEPANPRRCLPSRRVTKSFEAVESRPLGFRADTTLARASSFPVTTKRRMTVNLSSQTGWWRVDHVGTDL